MASRGKFIVLEGIDGCGKTTVATVLAKQLGNAWVTKEPTRSNRKIAAILKHKKVAPSPLALQKLYIEDRLAHTKKIEKILKSKSVVCQRYAMSTFAYGTAFGVSQKDLEHKFLKPDATFLLDISAKAAMKRITKRKETREYFEKEKSLEKIRKRYLSLAKKFDAIVIDAMPSPKEIVDKMIDLLGDKER